MNARNYLMQYQEATRRAGILRNEYNKELELIDSVRSPLSGDGLPHGSGISKTVEDRAIRLADKAAALKIAELDALMIRQEIFETIIQIGGLERDVLIERYINLRTWDGVCKAVNYSWPSVRAAWHRGEAMIEAGLEFRK